MTTFLDTNVLMYLIDENSQFHAWAISQLEARLAEGPAVISDIVYCEFSVGMQSIEDTDIAISSLSLERVRGSAEAFFRAGRAYQIYRDVNGGPKTQVLPDFIIGATAEV